jgi:hypothetical protein
MWQTIDLAKGEDTTMAWFQGYYQDKYKFTVITTANGKGWLSYIYRLSDGHSVPCGWSQPTFEEALEYTKSRIEDDCILNTPAWSSGAFHELWKTAETHNFTHPMTWLENAKLNEQEEARKDHDAAEARATRVIQLLGQYARTTDPAAKKIIRGQLRANGHYLSRQK